MNLSLQMTVLFKFLLNSGSAATIICYQNSRYLVLVLLTEQCECVILLMINFSAGIASSVDFARTLTSVYRAVCADCLSSFTEIEELEDTELYMCGNCKIKQKSTKKFWIRRLPNVSDCIPWCKL